MTMSMSHDHAEFPTHSMTADRLFWVLGRTVDGFMEKHGWLVFYGFVALMTLRMIQVMNRTRSLRPRLGRLTHKLDQIQDLINKNNKATDAMFEEIRAQTTKLETEVAVMEDRLNRVTDHPLPSSKKSSSHGTEPCDQPHGCHRHRHRRRGGQSLLHIENSDMRFYLVRMDAAKQQHDPHGQHGMYGLHDGFDHNMDDHDGTDTVVTDDAASLASGLDLLRRATVLCTPKHERQVRDDHGGNVHSIPLPQAQPPHGPSACDPIYPTDSEDSHVEGRPRPFRPSRLVRSSSHIKAWKAWKASRASRASRTSPTRRRQSSTDLLSISSEPSVDDNEQPLLVVNHGTQDPADTEETKDSPSSR